MNKLETFSLTESQAKGILVGQILASTFAAVEPGAAVKRYLLGNGIVPGARSFLLGIGKAACAMTQAAADLIQFTDALVITKHAQPLNIGRVTVIEGNHPVPGEASLQAGAVALKFVSQLTQNDLLLCLISGGGSALMTAPYVPLSELQSLTTALLASGARIDEINILRRHLDQLKGGGLVRFANGARIESLLLSDLVDDSIEAISSGPTAPDPATCADALSILEKYKLRDKIPDSIYRSLRETLKPADPVFDRVQNIVIGSNRIALIAAQVQSAQAGFEPIIFQEGVQGEARVVGRDLARQFKEMLNTYKRPFCLLMGGETTVTLTGSGRGGRNQELALAAVEVLAGLDKVMLISIATDGEDGPTDAAGAVVTGETAQRAESLGMSAADYLSRNDAYSFFDALQDLIKIGPSGTNVNDLALCFAF